MSPSRALVACLAGTALLSGLLGGPSGSAAGATAPAAIDGAVSSVASGLSPQATQPGARASLTPREKRLSKAKRCTARQAKRTPVRCKRIKAAKAKAARIKAAAKASPPASPAAQTFTVAVFPDTQNEVFGTDPRIRQRSQWLVQQRQALNLRFVNHIGDVVNWGWLQRSQFDVASAGMRPLEAAGIPYSLSIGNHDTAAVGHDNRPGRGYGGGAYVNNPECRERLGAVACDTKKLVRRTTEFNDYFSAARFGAVKGVFEAGKVDNTYSTFTAGGRQWMVLNLELWPRAAAVDWAKRVVAAHPRHNVIVSTHAYLDGDRAGISTSNGGYGSTSPRYLWDQLISQFPNVKVVLSGHVGSGAVRQDTTRHGTKVVSLLQAFHSADGNPVRLLRIDPAQDSIHTWVTSPNGRGGSFARHTHTVGGLGFVR